MCPILTAAKIMNSRFSSVMASFVSCQKDKCEWWDSERNCCALKRRRDNE